MKKCSFLSILRLGLLSGLFLSSFSALAQNATIERPELPNVRFSRNLKNSEIISALGGRVDGVAQHHGQSGSEFRNLIARDRCLCADRQAHMYYACDPMPKAAGGASAATGTTSRSTTTTVSATAAAMPLLHSRPGSQRVIYLDFDGHTTTGTAWNSNFTGGASFTTPPYDTEGDITTLSTVEAANIEAIWRRVAEDYAPFDIDVTTEAPAADALIRSGSTDLVYGVRVCVGGSSYDWFAQGAGGVAYLGSFTWNSDTPCFVFTAQLGNGDPKYTAEAASHEAGHTVGLNHDGLTNGTEYYSGHGDWAPIMGVGYYKTVTQWSKGEYPNANNTQDDVAVMATYGVNARTDDHGSTQVTATLLTGTSLSASGIVSTRADVDIFQFSSGAGQISFNAIPAAPGPNLDAAFAL
jgi:hypothetical protein